MIPRLAPRRTNRRSLSLEVTGVENASPFLSTVQVPIAMDIGDSSSSSSTDEADFPPPMKQALDQQSISTVPIQQQQLHQPMERRREALSNNKAALNHPLSPCPAPSNFSQQQQLLEPFKSPLPSDTVLSDWSGSDFSVTPPVTGPRPLVVSAKRFGQDVRRKHSNKRRRCRSWKKATNDDGASSFSDTTSNNNIDGASCLWKDANAPPSQQDDSSEEEEESLPFLFSQDEQVPLQKQAEQYWEYCYGKQLPTTTATIALPTAGWSAKRRPPSKGCLSHKKLPKTEDNAANKFKTPPTSPEEEAEAAAAAAGIVAKYVTKKGPRVQFGSPQAVEYEVDGPTAQLTPLPSEVTRKRYSMDQKKVTEEEEEMTVETKRNSAVLAEWEEELKPMSSASRRRQQRKNRRSSSLFTPSPMSLLNSDDEDETDREKDRQQQNVSPSTIVMENLASLCVDSPAADAQKPSTSDTSTTPPTLTPLSAGSDDSSSSENSSVRRSRTTAEFAINLESVNASGGGMDTTPPKLDIPVNLIKPSATLSKSSLASAETTPPPSNMSLDTIHSVGGALDHASPATLTSKNSCSSTNRHSPISRMSGGSQELKDREDGYIGGITTSARIDIAELLLKDPSADQAWEAKDVFQNLAEKMQTKSRISSLLESIGPRLEGVLSCFEDLNEQARFCASTKSNTKFKLPATEAPHARKLALREWMDMETEFLLELSEALQRNTERAVQLLQNAGIVVNEAMLLPISIKNRRKQLESEISLLEKQIKQHEEFMPIQEALDAPYAALRCQATSHIGVCGFRLDEYTGTCLQLSYEHPIAGVESQFCFDLTQGTWKASYISDAFISSSNLLSSIHPAAKFHEKLAKCCFDDQNGLLHRLQGVELQEAVMLLSRWLGLLDVAMKDLIDVSADYPVTVEWPVVSVAVPSELSENKILRLTYDPKATQKIRPTTAVLSRSGKDDEYLSISNGADYMNKLLADVTSSEKHTIAQ